MEFEVIGSIEERQVIAKGLGVTIQNYLRKAYGRGSYQAVFGRHMKQTKNSFALCIDNSEHVASLIPAKVYRVIPDQRAAKDDLVRIVDESGEDYLYHRRHFVFIDLPPLIGKHIQAIEDAS